MIAVVCCDSLPCSQLSDGTDVEHPGSNGADTVQSIVLKPAEQCSVTLFEKW
jgi:hypothetical protein